MDRSISQPSAASPKATPRIPLEPLSFVLGNTIRWQLMAELATGEPLRVMQLAKALEQKPDIISKHLQAMCWAGVVEYGENRLYRLPEHFMPDPDKWEIDFGHCVVRLPDPITGKRKRR